MNTGLTQHPGREHDVEHAPAEGSARLLRDHRCQLLLALLHDLSGALQNRAALRKRSLRPGPEGRVRGVNGTARVIHAGRGGNRGNLTGVRVDDLIGGPRSGRGPFAANQQLLLLHA
jgi:hypothetical protein